MFAARGQVHRNLVNARRDKDYNKQVSENSVEDDTELPEGNGDGVVDANNGLTDSDKALATNVGAATSSKDAQAKGPDDSGDSSPREKADAEEFKLWPLEGVTGRQRMYLAMCNRGIRVLRHSWFNSAVMLCISWASLSVGFQTYPALATSVILDDLDLGVLAIFILEAVLKIMAEGLKPWIFFTGKEMRWNCFDFGIIIMSLPIWGSALGGGNIAILRMLRLMRIMKLVKRIPQLYMIVMGLIGGLKSIGYILLLLFLVFYLYAISGMYAWKDNDAFHFRSVPIAMVTLFRMSTLENWSNVRPAASSS